VPFSIISSSVGGTPAEFWTSYEAMADNPTTKPNADGFDNSVKTFPDRLAKYKQDEPALLEKYNQDMAKHNQELADAKAASTTTAPIVKRQPPSKPMPPQDQCYPVVQAVCIPV